MSLEQRIAQIVALGCLTPAERADMILAQPALKLRRIRVAVCNRAEMGGGHGRTAA